MATTVTLEDLQKIVADIGIAMKESEAARERDRAEHERKREADNQSMKDAQEELNKTVNHLASRIGNSIGYITEMILLPGIRKKMIGYGHIFDSVAVRKEFYLKNSVKAFSEADLILENGIEVMVVEVKTHLTKDDVSDHLERLNRLRENEKAAKVDGKALISGVAGVIIDESAKTMAKKYGMYIIQMVETDQNITVEAPEKVGRW